LVTGRTDAVSGRGPINRGGTIGTQGMMIMLSGKIQKKSEDHSSEGGGGGAGSGFSETPYESPFSWVPIKRACAFGVGKQSIILCVEAVTEE